MADTVETENFFNHFLNYFTLTLLAAIVTLWILIAHASIDQRLITIDSLLARLNLSSILRLIILNRNWEVKGIDLNTTYCVY